MRVILVLADDQRYDDHRWMPKYRARLAARGVTFRQHRAGNAACSPGRAATLTGLLSQNHNVGAGNTEQDYLRYMRNGFGGIGPWESATETALSGCLPNWLSNAGVTTGMFGKYQNGYSKEAPGGSTNPADHIPPGWDHWCAAAGDFNNSGVAGYSGGANNKHRSLINENGTLYWYDHALGDVDAYAGTGDGLSYANRRGGYFDEVIAIRLSEWIAARAETESWFAYWAPYNPHEGYHVNGQNIVEDDDVEVEDDYAGAVNKYLMADDIRSSNHNRITAASWSGGVLTLTFGTVDGYDDVETISGASFVSVFAPHNFDAEFNLPSHGWNNPAATPDTVYLTDPTGNANAQAGKFPKTYVAPNQLQISVSTNPNASQFVGGVVVNHEYLTDWAERWEMLLSLDDQIERVDQALEDRGWSGTTWIIYSADNGQGFGEHGLFYNEGGFLPDGTPRSSKATCWDSVQRLPLVVRGPGLYYNVSETITALHDLPLTVLDIFGLTTHDAHTERDGLSLFRLAQYPNRAILLENTTPSTGIVEWDGVKYLPTGGIGEMYDTRVDQEEVDNISADNATRRGTMVTRMAAMFNTATGGEDYRTA